MRPRTMSLTPTAPVEAPVKETKTEKKKTKAAEVVVDDTVIEPEDLY